jgi:hypothetical protein
MRTGLRILARSAPPVSFLVCAFLGGCSLGPKSVIMYQECMRCGVVVPSLDLGRIYRSHMVRIRGQR